MSAAGRAVGLALGVVLAVAAPLQGQQAASRGLSPDPTLAKQGENLFVQRGCLGCHTIGKGKGVGPDLAGVFRRRSLDWLRRWLKAPDQMLTSDSTAKSMLSQFNDVPMPNMGLNDKEVEALLHYIAWQEAKVPGP